MEKKFYDAKGENFMKCMKCGAEVEKSFTTDIFDLGECILIIRNIPCYKCEECTEII